MPRPEDMDILRLMMIDLSNEAIASDNPGAAQLSKRNKSAETPVRTPLFPGKNRPQSRPPMLPLPSGRPQDACGPPADRARRLRESAPPSVKALTRVSSSSG